jgi:hypothetical protein
MAISAEAETALDAIVTGLDDLVAELDTVAAADLAVSEVAGTDITAGAVGDASDDRRCEIFHASGAGFLGICDNGTSIMFYGRVTKAVP